MKKNSLAKMLLRQKLQKLKKEYAHDEQRTYS